MADRPAPHSSLLPDGRSPNNRRGPLATLSGRAERPLPGTALTGATDPLRQFAVFPYDADMARPTARTAENVGFAVGLFAAVAALVMAKFGGPEWGVNLVVGIGFVVAIPTMLLNLRRRWRGD